jgi:hypothetical protein
VYLKLNDIVLAKADYETALRITPHHPEAQEKLDSMRNS